MQLALVIGTVVATQKDPNLVGQKLLVIRGLTPRGEQTGRAIVALDAAGAGVGERVFFVRGREASHAFLPVDVPTDAAIVGIVDHWSLE